METVDSDFHSPQLGALWLGEGEGEGEGSLHTPSRCWRAFITTRPAQLSLALCSASLSALQLEAGGQASTSAPAGCSLAETR